MIEEDKKRGKLWQFIKSAARDGAKEGIADVVKTIVKYFIILAILVVLTLFGINVFEDSNTNSTSNTPTNTAVPNVANPGNPVNPSVGSVSVNGCPYDAQGFELVYAETWYADPYGFGYSIGFHSDGSFETYDPYSGNTLVYQAVSSRNVWIPLNQSPFVVCVDSSNYVFAKYNG